MKYLYRNVECTFREFISAYLASTPFYASDERAVSMAQALLTQHIVGQTLSEEQCVQIDLDTGGQCRVKYESADELMNIPTPTVLLGVGLPPLSGRRS